MEMPLLSWILLIGFCLFLALTLFYGLSFSRVNSELKDTKSEVINSLENSRKLSIDLSKVESELIAEKRISEERTRQFNDSKTQLTEHFKNLANEILEEKSQRFATQNQQSLDILLKPLHEKIGEFKKRVDDVYADESRERFALKSEIEKLAGLNHSMSVETQALTKALRGDNKAQGNWGELVLETILESSGLRKGHEFDVQDAQVDTSGNRLQPDVVIHLPEGKHLVIDSKVSISAYARHVQVEDDVEKERELVAHVNSLKAHVTGLSSKNYQQLYGLGSIDFVLMFIPIEPAFLAAMAYQGSLFQDALAKNIILVCPSTLLATVRTVAHLWRQEHQNRNAQEIAKQCGALYDKFVGFVDDLEEVGKRIEQTQQSYMSAHNKLKTGRMNLIKSAERVRELGVKPTKELKNQLLLDADHSHENESNS